MKIILVEGNEVLVDDEDYSFITNMFDLSIRASYVHCSLKERYKGMGLRSTSLQKVLMLPEKVGRSIVVDHKDGNELNNQKSNLRVTTLQNNMRNRRSKVGSSIFKGVYWFKQLNCWRTMIRIDKGKRIQIGLFSNEEAAASAYNHYAKQYHGEYACLNEVSKMMESDWERYRIEKPSTSRYRGVSLIDGKWVSQICDKRKNYNLGSFEIEEEAALAYNAKAIELKGNKAKLNLLIRQ